MPPELVPPPDHPPPAAGRRSSALRWLALGLLVLLVGGAMASGLSDYLWQQLKAYQAELERFRAEHAVLTAAVFFLVYVVATGLSLPVGTVLTLAGGFLFGRWLGLGLVSFASTAGATLACLSVRYLFREAALRRLGPRLEAINRGVETDGAYYLFILRLAPVFPFFLVNAALGLTRMPIGTYWWVSQLGMLPVTLVYVNAGTELSRVNAPRDILSPGLLLSLAAVSVVPLLLRKVFRRTAAAPASPE